MEDRRDSSFARLGQHANLVYLDTSTNINFLVDQQEVLEVSGSRLFVYPDHVDSSTATVHGYPDVILAADPEAPYASFVGRMVSTRPEITLIAPTRPTKDQLLAFVNSLGLPSTLNWE